MFAAPQLASTRLPVFSPPCPLYLTPQNHASLLGQCLPRCLCSVLMLRQLLSLPSQPFFSPRLLTHDGGPFRSRRPRGVGGCSLCRAQRRAVQTLPTCAALWILRTCGSPKLAPAKAGLAAHPAAETAVRRTAGTNPAWPRRRRGRPSSWLRSRRSIRRPVSFFRGGRQ